MSPFLFPMNSRTKVKRALSAALEAQPLDRLLVQMSFAHRRGTLLNKRECVDLVQAVEFCFDMSPRYEPNARADVLPQVQVYSDAIVPVFAAMTSAHAAARAFSGPMLIREQIRNLAPPAEQEDHWYLYDDSQVRECACRLGHFAESWCLPFLKRYCSLTDLADGYERGDGRLPNDRRFRLYMSACYVVLGKPEQAMHNLQRFFGKLGSRKDYAQAFAYLSTLLG